MTEQPGPRPQRIGDAERDRAADLLREHLATGRLDQDEFDERLTQALTAKTADDLDPLFSDLPGPRPGTVVPVTPSFQAPPWQQNATPAVPEPTPNAVAPSNGARTALTVAASVAWPITILLITFGLSWQNFWWLVFIPIVLSSMAGNNHRGNRHRDRDQRRIDRGF